LIDQPVSCRVLQELEMIWKHNVILDAGKICRTLKTVAEEDYGVYIPYLTNAAYQERKLAEFKLVNQSSRQSSNQLIMQSISHACRQTLVSSGHDLI